MRKIEQQMCEAVRQAKTWKSGNTQVLTYKDGQTLILLHDNLIAFRDAPWEDLRPNAPMFEEYPTRTTSSRLSALGFDVCIRQGEAYIDGIKARDWRPQQQQQPEAATNKDVSIFDDAYYA